MWPDTRLTELFGIDVPIVQAPMAGAGGSALAIAVSAAGGLGSLPCAMLDVEAARAEIGVIRQRTDRPFNVNFFCHEPAGPEPERQAAWRAHLAPFYSELGLDPDAEAPTFNRMPFDEAMCELVEDARPKVVSFHFGLPAGSLLERVRKAGCLVIASATTAEEARWLEAGGCDAVIAQGSEAGGHRGMFLTKDIATQAGTMALVPQVVDAIAVPVIAAGGIGDGRSIAAAFALGAAGVQIGTAYLFTPEATITDHHRAALDAARDDITVLTNIFSGRPARGIATRIVREAGPMSGFAPAFPTAGGAIAPLRQAAEGAGSIEFSQFWSGQAAALCHRSDAGSLTRELAEDGLRRLEALAGTDIA